MNADGSRDNAFGFGGVGAATQFEPFASYGLVQKSDGKILSGGGIWNPPGSPPSFNIMQLHADWQGVDESFGVDGLAAVDIGPGTDALLDMVVDSHNRIVAVGYTSANSNSAAVRLLPNGVPDPTFGTSGVRVLNDIPDRSVRATRVVLRPDGGLLFAGTASKSGPNPELFVVSLNEDGSLDESFAGQGWQEIDTAPDPGAIFIGPFRAALTIHPEGKIIVMNWACACMAMLEAPPWNRRPGDHDGDGKSDILWRNSLTGQIWMYLMNGNVIDTSAAVNTVANLDWKIVGNGDYNNDGKADILWHNNVTGQVWMNLMNGTAISMSSAVVTVSNLDWKIVGGSDYNNDGNADILWHNDVTGQVWMYLMNGTVISTSSAVVTISNLEWKIVDTGDFNGDGKDDILWRNDVTGQVWMYLMNGSVISTSSAVGTVSDLNWKIVGVDDFNGDNKDDILWRNSVTGQVWMYLMNGTAISTSSAVVTVSNLDWKIVGNGDYNNDGNADILWRNDVTGQVWMYLMNGATIATSVGINTVPTDWIIVNGN